MYSVILSLATQRRFPTTFQFLIIEDGCAFWEMTDK